MSSKDAPITQRNINKYLKGWIGVSVAIAGDSEEDLPVLFLEFGSKCHATSAYLFLSSWQNYLENQSLRFSVVEEADGQLSCSFCTPDTSFSKKEQFRGNFNLEKIKTFVANCQHQPNYRVITRCADENYDVNEVQADDVEVRLCAIDFQKRNRVAEGQVECE